MTNPCSEKGTIEVLKAYQEDIRGDVKDIKKALLGDANTEGLVTKVSVHRKYFKLIAYFGGPLIVGITIRVVWAWIGQ